jgi:hypothetical protein
MSRITLWKGLLLNLEGKIQPPERREYLTREQALEQLKARTGQDFGYDAAAWREWLKLAKLL